MRLAYGRTKDPENEHVLLWIAGYSIMTVHRLVSLLVLLQQFLLCTQPRTVNNFETATGQWRKCIWPNDHDINNLNQMLSPYVQRIQSIKHQKSRIRTLNPEWMTLWTVKSDISALFSFVWFRSHEGVQIFDLDIVDVMFMLDVLMHSFSVLISQPAFYYWTHKLKLGLSMDKLVMFSSVFSAGEYFVAHFTHKTSVSKRFDELQLPFLVLLFPLLQLPSAT